MKYIFTFLLLFSIIKSNGQQVNDSNFIKRICYKYEINNKSFYVDLLENNEYQIEIKAHKYDMIFVSLISKGIYSRIGDLVVLNDTLFNQVFKFEISDSMLRPIQFYNKKLGYRLPYVSDISKKIYNHYWKSPRTKMQCLDTVNFKKENLVYNNFQNNANATHIVFSKRHSYIKIKDMDCILLEGKIEYHDKFIEFYDKNTKSKYKLILTTKNRIFGNFSHFVNGYFKGSD